MAKKKLMSVILLIVVFIVTSLVLYSYKVRKYNNRTTLIYPIDTFEVKIENENLRGEIYQYQNHTEGYYLLVVADKVSGKYDGYYFKIIKDEPNLPLCSIVWEADNSGIVHVNDNSDKSIEFYERMKSHPKGADEFLGKTIDHQTFVFDLKNNIDDFQSENRKALLASTSLTIYKVN